MATGDAAGDDGRNAANDIEVMDVEKVSDGRR